MTELALVKREGRSPVRRSLADWAEIANREHAAALDAASSAVGHAIRAGVALNEAREQIRHGEWARWLAENCPAYPYQTAVIYMRVARYATVTHDAVTLREAIALTRGLGRVISHPPALMEEAKRLKGEGISSPEIARRLDVDVKTVRRWVDPNARKRQKAAQLARSQRWHASQQALRQRERDAAIKKIGGSAAEAYSLLRRCLQTVDRALHDADERDAKIALGSAIASLHRAEDEIARALKVHHTTARPRRAA